MVFGGMIKNPIKSFKKTHFAVQGVVFIYLFFFNTWIFLTKIFYLILLS